MSRMKKITKQDVKKFFTDLFYVLLGCSISSFAVTAVLLPNGLSSGGVTGIVRILQSVVPLGFSVLYYIAMAAILIVIAIFLGFKEVRKVILVSILYPAVLMVFEALNFQLLEETDIILAAIFCGILWGISSGIFFYRGFSFGGTDAIAKIIRRKLLPHISLSQILLAIDAAIILSSAAVFGRNIALYALITQIIFAKTVDYVIYGFETKIVQLEIITSHKEKVTEYIMNDIGRGVSSIEVTGEYTGEKRQKLILLCSPRESVMVKKHVASVDRNALVTVIHVDNVWGRGEGFGDIQKEM